MNLVFIPVWLEKVLKANGESLAFALEPENLRRILSTRDLDLYTQSQNAIYALLPNCISETFKGLSQTVQDVLDVEQKRGYLYGFLPGNDELSVTPKFEVTHAGHDNLVLTVAKDAELPDIDSIYLMEAIIEILTSVQPFEEVAKLPIMEAWLKATAINRIL